MFARLTTTQMKIDRLDEAVKLYEESVIPAAKSQRGYRGVYFLIDRKTGKGVTFGQKMRKKEDGLQSTSPVSTPE